MRKVDGTQTKRFSQAKKSRVYSSEDVEFSKVLADEDDKEALARAREADDRQQT